MTQHWVKGVRDRREPQGSEGNVVVSLAEVIGHQGGGVPHRRWRCAFARGRRHRLALARPDPRLAGWRRPPCPSPRRRRSCGRWGRRRGATRDRTHRRTGKGMKPGQGELGPFLFHAVLARDGVHAQTALQHPALAHLHPVLQIRCQIAPAHHLDLSRGILRPETLKTGHQFRHRRLVVLGIPQLGCLQHLHFEQTVIHTLIRWDHLPS